MKANATSRFSDICPAFQQVLTQLIRNEYQVILGLPDTILEEEWAKAVLLANPTLVYVSGAQAHITIYPDSRRALLGCLQECLYQLEI